MRPLRRKRRSACIKVFRTLVSVEDLRAHLGDPDWVIVDCRHSLLDFQAGERAYAQGHIPGAFFARVEEDLAGEKNGRNGRHPLPDPQTFAAFLRELGVNETTQLIAYDAGGDMFAARLWFLARYIGHEIAAVLDGGIAAWIAAGGALTNAPAKRPRNGTIAARPRPEMIVDSRAVLASLPSHSLEIVDARGADRFAGENETIDPVGGHIPGARNRPFRINFDESGRFKTARQLREEFEALDIPPQRLVHQCGSGVSAAVNLLAMEHAGIAGSRLYPGSWSEWCADPSRPIER